MQAWTRLIPALALALPAFAAAGAEDLGVAVRQCRAETEAAARLACYDRAADRAFGAPAVAAAPKAAPEPPKTVSAPPAAAAAAAAPAAASAEDAFGRERRAEAEAQAKLDQEARALGELEATVTTIQQRADGLMTITLDNGQVWRQNRPDSKFRLKEGDPVKIQPGSLKSFILSGPTNRSTRVTRVD